MEDIEHIMDHATQLFEDADAIRLEDSLWWYVGRRAIIRMYMDLAKRETPIPKILEVGCGSGGDLGLLSEYGEVTAVERSEILARRAQSRNVVKEVLVGDFFDLDIPHDFNMTCLFDVLEHIEDDDGFLKKLDKSIKSGHLLLLSVPACQFLYSLHDALLHHYRRYSKKRLHILLERNGYRIVKSSYFVFFLLPLVALSRFKEKVMSMLGIKQTAVNIGVVPEWMNQLFTWVLKLEATISQIVPFPIGVWLIVLAVKK